MPTLAKCVDAVVGINSHHDSHEVQITSSTGTLIAAVTISKNTAGYSELLSWIVTHTPGPRLAVSGQDTSCYAAGLARAAAAAGLAVIEPEQPVHPLRRGKGQPSPVDAHVAALTALHLDADRLSTSRAEADRDALRILLGARQDLTTTTTKQGTRLRALLLSGDRADRKIARATLTEAALISLARRPEPRSGIRQQVVRHGEIRRLALLLIATGRELRANSTQLRVIVDDLAPGLTDCPGIGPISAAQAIVSWSGPAPVPAQRRPPALEATRSLLP